jgi:hypothetical protein
MPGDSAADNQNELGNGHAQQEASSGLCLAFWIRWMDKDRPDYIVCSGQWDIGRIYQTQGGPENMPLALVDDRERAHDTSRPCTLEEANAAVQKCWINGRSGRSWKRLSDGTAGGR